MGRKSICLALAVFVFTLIADFSYIVSDAYAAGPVIGGSPQMSVNSNQTLTASGGSGGPYTWSIVGGGGALSDSTGDSVTYYAPSLNPYCENSPTIIATDSSGQSTEFQIAVNGSTGGQAYISYTEACDQNIPANTPFPNCECMSGPTPGAYHFGNCCVRNYTCDGTMYSASYQGGMWSWNIWPNWCAGKSCYGGARTDDVRSPTMKANGCCPSEFVTTETGPGDLGGGTCTDTGTDSGDTNIPGESAINIKSGNLYHSQDVAGLTLHYNSYNSTDNADFVLGSKWTHNYNMKLTAYSDNATLSLRTADGKVIFFRKSGSVYYPDAISGDTSQFVKNPDGSYTWTLKNGISHNFTLNGRLSSITDRNGNTSTLNYGTSLSSITDHNGRTTTITGTRISKITDPAGRAYNLAYTWVAPNYVLTSITDPLGNAWQFTYDSNARMLTKKDPANRTTTHTYDSKGRLLTATDPEGKTRTLSYTQRGTTTHTEKDGGIWTYTYNPTYAIKTAKTDPLGNATSYTYDIITPATKDVNFRRHNKLSGV